MSQRFIVGDRVAWFARSRKYGVVVAVVPAGKLPRDVMDSRVDVGTCSPRSHESYVVNTQPNPDRAPRLYWPRVGTLVAVTGGPVLFA